MYIGTYVYSLSLKIKDLFLIYYNELKIRGTFILYRTTTLILL